MKYGSFKNNVTLKMFIYKLYIYDMAWYSIKTNQIINQLTNQPNHHT